MTNPNDERERALDDLIRTASDRDADEGAITRAVFDRLDAGARRPVLRLPDLGPVMAAASFTMMLLAAGYAGYSLPGPAPEDDVLTLAIGDTRAIGGLIRLGLGDGE